MLKETLVRSGRWDGESGPAQIWLLCHKGGSGERRGYHNSIGSTVQIPQMAFLKTHPYKAEVKFKWCFRCWTYRVIISYGHLITAVQFKLIEGGRFLRHFKGGLKCRFDSRHHTSHFACIWDLCPMLRPLLLICVLKRKRREKKGWSRRRTHNFMPSYNKSNGLNWSPAHTRICGTLTINEPVPRRR